MLDTLLLLRLRSPDSEIPANDEDGRWDKALPASCSDVQSTPWNANGSMVVNPTPPSSNTARESKRIAEKLKLLSRRSLMLPPNLMSKVVTFPNEYGCSSRNRLSRTSTMAAATPANAHDSTTSIPNPRNSNVPTGAPDIAV